MAIGTETEDDEIEAWELTLTELEKGANAGFVLGGGLLRIWKFGAHPVYVFGRHGDFRQESFVRHAVVAVGMVGWDVSLVANENKSTVPGKAGVILGELGVKAAGSGPSRERNGEAALGADGGTPDADELLGGRVKKIGGRSKYLDGSISRHGLSKSEVGSQNAEVKNLVSLGVNVTVLALTSASSSHFFLFLLIPG